MTGPRRRLLAAGIATLVLVIPLAVLWGSSLTPRDLSVMDMGYLDYGGGPVDASMEGHEHHQAGSTDVSSLTEPPGKADVKMQLVARAESLVLAGGRTVNGYTLNGTSPGPTLNAAEGDLVEVTLVNDNVAAGITLHWHGIDVPNAMDGVAGVTQDAVPSGGRYVYRFLADRAGTYWYHSHQVSHKQVANGLLGAIVIRPRQGETPRARDVVALTHRYGGARTVNGTDGDQHIDAQPGEVLRIRVIDTDNGPMTTWVTGAPYRVAAVDGIEVNEPTPITDRALLVAAGGRNDLEITMPADGRGVRVDLGGTNALLLGNAEPAGPRQPAPADFVDLLTYGAPKAPAFDTDRADRTFDYKIGRRPGFVRGRPGLWWTINGRMYPDVPMFVVSEGDVVRMKIANSSGELHPMHLHGHHAVVLSRNGKSATGSPWLVDSLNVGQGESYEIAFVADNPGIWIDHCHDLPHAQEGLIAHLMYTGYTTPFELGGTADNEPE